MWVWLRYQLERWVLRGSLALVALMVGVLGCVAVLGATIAYSFPARYFGSYRDALWWAVLRLSDTGYLSDDTGGLELRALSIAMSVFGMSITVGGIVAIVTQLMNRGLRSLAAATTQVPFSGHIVILGFSDRTPRLLQSLLAQGPFKIVVLLDRVDDLAVRQLSRAVRKAVDRERVTLRSGSARRAAELEHAACSRARAIILPASQLAVAGDPEAGPRTLQTMLALKTVLADCDDPPEVAVEVVDRSLAPMVSSTFPDARVLQSDRLVARVFRFALQSTGLVEFGLDVIEPGRGFRIEELRFPELIGTSLGEAERRLLGGQLMGVMTDEAPGVRRLAMDAKTTIGKEDSLLLFTDTKVGLAARCEEVKECPKVDLPRPELKVLILGWNESAPDLLSELNLEAEGRYAVDFVTDKPADERELELSLILPVLRLKVRHFVGDPIFIDEAPEIQLKDYDRVLILANRLVPPDSADVRTLAVVLALRQRRSEMKALSYVLVELLEQENAHVLGDVQAVVTARLAADTLCSLVLTPNAGEALQMSLGHQLTFVTRIFEVPVQLTEDPRGLGHALRERHMAHLHTFPPQPGAQKCRILACEAVTPADVKPQAGPSNSLAE